MYKMYFAAIVALAFATLLAPPAAPQETSAIKSFRDKLKAYVDLRKMLEGQLPGLKSTNDAAAIAAHRSALTAKLVESRSGAHQGEIFTPETAAQFRTIIQETFREPGSQLVRRTVQEGDAPKPIVVKVNTVYPDNSPVVTTPPTLLMKLPELPAEMAYRILGRSFILLDNKTNLIVDFIPDVVP